MTQIAPPLDKEGGAIHIRIYVYAYWHSPSKRNAYPV